MSDQNTSLPEVSYANHANQPQTTPAAPEVVMSTPQTLANIFFEPTRTFTALRDRPRFLIAAAIIAALLVVFSGLFVNKVGMDRIGEAQIRANNPDATQEDIDKAAPVFNNPILKAFVYVQPIILIAIIFAIGGVIYLLGTMAMGNSISFKQALSVWTYSSLPPTLLLMLANIIVLLLKSNDDIDPIKDASNLVHANPSLLIERADHPVLATLLGTIDPFSIYGLVLAAIGLSVVGKMKSGSAWTIVLIIFGIGVLFRLIISYARGVAI